MESPEDSYIELLNLGLLLKEKEIFLEHTEEQITGIKEEIREMMTIHDIKKFDDPKVKIKLTRSYAFDIGSFRLEEPEVSKNFVTEEIITKTKIVIDKKSLKKLLPATYKRFQVELTPRLRVT